MGRRVNAGVYIAEVPSDRLFYQTRYADTLPPSCGYDGRSEASRDPSGDGVKISTGHD